MAVEKRKAERWIRLIETVKRILPLDLGQSNYRYTTKGKMIALALAKKIAKKSCKQNENTPLLALDFGCGEGEQSRWLEQCGFIVTSIDIEKRYEKCEIIDPNEAPPFPKECFDLVWCSEVIEHVDDPKFTLNEFLRITKNGGHIILTTPNSYAWFFRIAMLLGFPPQLLQQKGHKHFFSLPDIRHLCPNSKVYGYFPYAGVKLTIQRWVGFLSPTFIVYMKKWGSKDFSIYPN